MKVHFKNFIYIILLILNIINTYQYMNYKPVQINTTKIISTIEIKPILQDIDQQILTANQYIKQKQKVDINRMQILYQYPQYPAGCEFAAAVMLLNAYNFYIDIPTIMQYSSFSNSDFYYSFWGSVYSMGAAYAPSMTNTLNNFLQQQNSTLVAYNISNTSWIDIENYILNGNPIMVWYTTDFQYPRYTNFYAHSAQMYANEHCITIRSIQGDKVEVFDSINGQCFIDKILFKDIWQACGAMAVKIE